jgi:tRNA-dihydrouridine synthase
VSQYSNEDGVDFVVVKHRWLWKQKEKVEDEVADAIEKSCSLHGVVHVR